MNFFIDLLALWTGVWPSAFSCYLMNSHNCHYYLKQIQMHQKYKQYISIYLFLLQEKKRILYHENEKSNMSRLWVNMFVYFWRGVFFCWKIVGLAVVDIDASFYRKVSFIRSQTWYYCENLYFLVFTENSNLFHLQYIRIMFQKYVSFWKSKYVF